MGSLSI